MMLGKPATLCDSENSRRQDKGKSDDHMAIAAEVKTQLIKDHGRHPTDKGSPEIQIAVLTARIGELTSHLKSNVKDHAGRRGLLMLVGKRNRLLRYLARTNREAYQSTIKRLGLRK
jgi:small subunit ribosomal protein S15